MADGTWLCTGRSIYFRKFNNLVLILLLLVLLMVHQPSDLARCARKKLHTLSQPKLQAKNEQVLTVSRPPRSRRSLSSAFNRFVPKHSKIPNRGGYNASDHEVPSGPNPISN